MNKNERNIIITEDLNAALNNLAEQCWRLQATQSYDEAHNSIKELLMSLIREKRSRRKFVTEAIEKIYRLCKLDPEDAVPAIEHTLADLCKKIEYKRY